MTSTRIGDRAVVLGASMAGLLVARVLSDAYREVIVVERDDLPLDATHRQGVPQGRHIHGLIGRGQQILDELFPGFTADLVARGAPVLDQLREARLYLGGHRLRQAESGVRVVSASRPLLEAYVRERVRGLPAVAFAGRRDIVGFATTADLGAVTGARVIRRADGSCEETIGADLVVDATGRGSRTPRWLAQLGYGRVAESVIATDIRYATTVVRLRSGALGDDRAVIAPPAPGGTRGGGLAPIEDGEHIVTMMGMLGDRPPTGREGFLGYAKSLPVPDIYDAIQDAELIADPAAIHFPAGVRRRYEQMAPFPDGLVVTGDALCSFNPIYGQGIGVAAIEAQALRRHLASGRAPRPRKVVRDMARAIDLPWMMASGADLAFPGVEGKRSAKVRVANAYIRRLQAAAESDAALGAAFLRVAALLDPPYVLFRPDRVPRVLSGRRLR